MMRRRSVARALTALIPLLGACSPLGPRPDPTVFLVLSSTERVTGGAAATASPGTNGAPALAAVNVGVGPVTLPAYLQRPQLVARVDETQVRVHEYARWSAPLATLFSEAMAEHLMTTLRPRNVSVYPWPPTDRPALSVRIAVQRFETVLPDSAVLRARWEVVDRTGNLVAPARVSEHRTASPLDPIEAPVALSRLVGMLANEIAAALRSGR
jgi:uncharacterized lipoprotein YmbA